MKISFLKQGNYNINFILHMLFDEHCFTCGYKMKSTYWVDFKDVEGSVIEENY